MTKMITHSLYVVEGTTPHLEGGWRQNISKQVLANDLYRAIEIFKGAFPDAVPHVIRKAGVAGSVLIDE